MGYSGARVALIFDPDNPSSVGHLRSLETAAPSFAVKSVAAAVHNPAEIEQAIEAFARERKGGLLIPPNTTLTSHRDLIVASAALASLARSLPVPCFRHGGWLDVRG
jgi:putative tryptophan/tyrosine transport system substrate-binding protein